MRATVLKTIVLAFVAVPLWGCIDDPDPSGRLPDPDWKCARPELTATEKAKQDEVDTANFDDYAARGWKVVEAKQTYLCTVIDCVDVNTVESAGVQPPAPPPPEEMVLPDGVGLQQTELDVHEELRCREGSMAMVRPSYSGYVFNNTAATSLPDWLDNYYEEVPGVPGGARRLYAGLVTVTPSTNGGANAWVNSFRPELEPGTMTLMETAVSCNHPDYPNELWQLVGIAARRDATNTNARANVGDWELKLGVEFLSAGYGDAVTGPGKGGWHGEQSTGDFKPRPGALYGPGMTFDPSTTSTVGGPQFESFFQIKLEDGKWWLGHNGNWLGFYETSLFPTASNQDLLSTHACQVHDYGEMADNRPDATTPPKTGVGSGQFADTGFGSAAYFRNPTYVDVNGITWYWLDVGPIGGAPGVITYSDQFGQSQYDPACYTYTPLSLVPGTPHRVMFAGGPGCP